MENPITLIGFENMIEDFSKICRFCLATDAHLKPIFADEGLKENVLLFAKIQLDENDELPHKVCTKCLQNLQVCINFKTCCEKSHFYLKNVLDRKKVIKLESKEVECEFKEDDDVVNSFNDNCSDIDYSDSKINVTKCFDEKTEGLFNCDECKFISSSKKHFKSHLKTHLHNVQTPIKLKMKNIKSKQKQAKHLETCEICGKTFNTVKALQKHIKTHTKDDDDTDDEDSDEKFKQKHKKINKTGNKKEPISCQHCQETFNTNKDLKSHVKVNHKDILQKKCEICDKVLSSLSAYRIHLRHHQDDRPYVCETCGKSFIQLVTLKEHALIHKGELPFKCPHCPHRSRQKQSLVVHMRIHTGERPYSCPLCSQTFTTSSNRAKHIRYHSDATPYHCEKCPKAYSYKEDLLDHVSVVHIGVQRHQCQICLKRFSSNSSLIHHRRVEHNIKRRYNGVGKVPEYLRNQETSGNHAAS